LIHLCGATQTVLKSKKPPYAHSNKGLLMKSSGKKSIAKE
jgi:hypothetical protein